MLIFLFLIEVVFAYDVVVRINDGKIGGSILQDYEGNNYCSFQSIPFAKPPVGTLRFKAPVKNNGWVGILNATKSAPFCPQYGTPIGQEDCLYLNVYSPKINAKLPVMFFIHGGLFREGSGSGAAFGPEFLMPRKIVLVTINYRLGYLGSLSFKNQSSGIPGNAHMKDQVMALKWVQKNIKKFGGNPKMVTIFGESVGGGSVNMHMLSPMSKGLFHRAISQSGWALTPWMEGYVGTGEVLANKLGINDESEENVIKKLQNIPLTDILDAEDKKIIVPVYKRNAHMTVVEAQTNEPAFLSKLAIDIIKSGDFMKVPYIMGYNNKECIINHALSYDYFGKPFCLSNFEEYIPFDVNLKTELERINLAKDFRTYFTNNSVNIDVETCTDLCTGSWFTGAFYRTLSLMINHSNKPIFAYRFSADTDLNVYKKGSKFTADMKGACHLDELPYLFTTPYTPKIIRGSDEEIVMKAMVKLWTTFAKLGKVDRKWAPVEKCKFNYLEINVNLTLGVNEDQKAGNFWSKVYQKYNGDRKSCENK